MSQKESALIIPCGDDQLCSILHHGSKECKQGVLILVGGPQYRVGSHRAFVLLARFLAQAGIAVMRFDYRGVGDSSGDFNGFENVELDISVAIDTFFEQSPSLESVVLWGLCDGASAAALYAKKESRVTGLVLVNPWVRTEVGLAKTQLNDYYKKFISRGFWLKLFSFKLDLKGAYSGLFDSLKSVRGGESSREALSNNSLPELMLEGLNGFTGDTLLILCDEDMTAQEFDVVVNGSSAWQTWVARSSVQCRRVAEADHTFSSVEWRGQLNELTKAWLLDL